MSVNPTKSDVFSPFILHVQKIVTTFYKLSTYLGQYCVKQKCKLIQLQETICLLFVGGNITFVLCKLYGAILIKIFSHGTIAIILNVVLMSSDLGFRSTVVTLH